MKERSLIERIIAILGVLLGTVAWVVRLLFSVVKQLLSSGSKPDGSEAAGARGGVADTAKTLATDLREKGGSLIDDAREKGQHLVQDAREKVDGVMNRGEDGGEEESAGFSAEGSAALDRSELSSTQHTDIGGVPERGPMAAASLSAMDAAYDEQSAAAMDQDDTGQEHRRMSEGIPNLEEPGEGDEAEMYGSESGALMGRHDESGYAGQPTSESDIGIDRGDSISGLADSGDRRGAAARGWVSDEVNLDQDEEAADYDLEGDEAHTDVAGNEDTVPAASRGWQAPADHVLEDDPLYGDFESSGAGGELDLRNDEADEADAAGMHIIDSPDEPFIEDEQASMSEGFVTEGTGLPFDTTTGDDIDVDEIGDETIAIDEDQLVADAFGRPAGGNARSGDLGPGESPDDAVRDPDESRPDYDVLGARAGSGVDEFADDAVAESMLGDVMDDADTEAPDGSTETNDAAGGSTSGTGSVAWASSAGVIDRDLAQPLSPDDLQSGSGASAADGEGGEPGVTEADADWKDVAADVAQDLGQEMSGRSVPTGTTMSGAGQSAGAMTSDDAASGEQGAGTMTSDVGSVETGGVPATDVAEGEGGSGEAITEASTGGRSFNDVLPESQYAERVGYGTLKADDMGNTGTDEWRGSFLTETSTPGLTPATSGGASGEVRDRSDAPASGSVRGDGSRICPPGYPIKGNASSKIYHRPTDSSYENTIAEFCFATEEDARAAGFRARRG